MTHVTKENTTSFLGMIEHFNMLFYWLVWLIAVLADTTQQVAKHLWLLIYWFMFLNTNCPPVFIYLFIFNLLCLHMNFHSLFFWLSTIFQLHSLICTDISTQNEYFLQLKGETGSWGGLGGEVFTRFTPKTRVCVIYVRGFCISTWSFQVKILKLIKHRHNATFSVEKKKILKTWLCLGKSTAHTTHFKALFSWLPWWY